MLVWAEANQGLLSSAALAAAIVAFLAEQRRANEAKAEAALAEAIRRQEGREAERKQQTAIWQDRKDRRLEQMTTFVRAASAIVRHGETALLDELEVMAGILGSSPTAVLSLSPTVQQAAQHAAESLTAILPAAPLTPDLILAVRKAVSSLVGVRATTRYYQSGEAQTWIKDKLDELSKSRGEINECLIVLTAQLSPRDASFTMPVDRPWPSSEIIEEA
jgi:hypothetical protein